MTTTTVKLATVSNVGDAVIIVIPNNSSTISNEVAREIKDALRGQVAPGTHDKILQTLNEAEYGAEYGWKTQPTPQPTAAVQLNLTERQAFVLHCLLNNVGGNPDGPRGQIGQILEQLTEKADNFMDGAMDVKLHSPGAGSIYLDTSAEYLRVYGYR
jgi:hypothetical protein